MILELSLIALTLLVMVLITGYTARTGIAPLPTSRPGRAVMLASLPEMANGGTLVEAGSGWGGLALRIARERPQVQVVGYELSPLPWLFSLLRSWLQFVPNVRFYRRDLREASFREVDVVVCYLHDSILEALASKLRAELPAGAVVVSNTFRIPGWRPSAIRQPAVRFDAPVYIYRIPYAYTGQLDLRS
ncbi:MAG: class I SAM-dependent methyltransferase [Halorhodospira sp.]